jgi:hypothetical protein
MKWWIPTTTHKNNCIFPPQFRVSQEHSMNNKCCSGGTNWHCSRLCKWPSNIMTTHKITTFSHQFRTSQEHSMSWRYVHRWSMTTDWQPCLQCMQWRRQLRLIQKTPFHVKGFHGHIQINKSTFIGPPNPFVRSQFWKWREGDHTRFTFLTDWRVAYSQKPNK